MNKFLLALMTMLLLVGCASTGGGGGTLPDVAPYDEATYDPLPAMVPAE
jgi:uncharacterized protein YceK